MTQICVTGPQCVNKIFTTNHSKYVVNLGKKKQSLNRPDQAEIAPRSYNSRHLKAVRLSALHTDRLYPQETFLVLISVRG
jgi:hypothetical protein